MPDILKEMLKEIPKGKVSTAAFEGANIVFYTKDAEFFLDNKGIIKEIVDTFKKRNGNRFNTMDLRSFKPLVQSIVTLVLLPIIGIFFFDSDMEDLELTDPRIGVGRESKFFYESISNLGSTDYSEEASIIQTNYIFLPLIFRDLVCGSEPEPPGDTFCPFICNGGCTDNICSIDCSEPYAGCGNSLIICPPGYACEVLCGGVNSCEGSTINCPYDYACDVVCIGANACKDAVINCSETGTCDLTCNIEIDVCTNAYQNCGFNQCSATCWGSSLPTTNCGPTRS